MSPHEVHFIFQHDIDQINWYLPLYFSHAVGVTLGVLEGAPVQRDITEVCVVSGATLQLSTRGQRNPPFQTGFRLISKVCEQFS